MVWARRSKGQLTGAAGSRARRGIPVGAAGIRAFAAKTAVVVTTALAMAIPGACPALAAAPSSGKATKPSKPAGRVITLAPHVTELIFAAGAGDKIVATVNSSNFPPQAKEIPRVGDGLSVNVEQLLAVQPDLVVAWQNTLAMQKLTPTLASLDIPVVYSAPRRLDDIPADIERLGDMLGTKDHAKAVADTLREQLAQLRDQYSDRHPVSVYIEVGTGPLYTLGDDTLTNDAIASCGGVNVFEDSALVAPTVTVESVLARDPDVLIIASQLSGRVMERANYWQGLKLRAAVEQHVYGIDPDTLVRPGPRLIEATQQLCEHMDQARGSSATMP